MLRRVATAVSDIEKKAEYESFRGNGSGKKVLISGITICLMLVFIEYFGKNEGHDAFIKFLGNIGLNKASDALSLIFHAHPDSQLFSLGWWVGIIVLCYAVIPMLIVRFVFREKLVAYGLGKGSIVREYRLFLLFLAVMIPLVLFFSGTEGFQYRYPFYRFSNEQPLWPGFWIWQALYFVQFIALEFFFRGFMVHSLKDRFGFYAVVVMTIPYCMIHFGKPFPETLAAIIAGLVLGSISLKSRSIWMGVLIHYSVALSMDLSALWQKGYFGNL